MNQIDASVCNPGQPGTDAPARQVSVPSTAGQAFRDILVSLLANEMGLTVPDSVQHGPSPDASATGPTSMPSPAGPSSSSGQAAAELRQLLSGTPANGSPRSVPVAQEEATFPPGNSLTADALTPTSADLSSPLASLPNGEHSAVTLLGSVVASSPRAASAGTDTSEEASLETPVPDLRPSTEEIQDPITDAEVAPALEQTRETALSNPPAPAASTVLASPPSAQAVASAGTSPAKPERTLPAPNEPSSSRVFSSTEGPRSAVVTVSGPSTEPEAHVQVLHSTTPQPTTSKATTLPVVPGAAKQTDTEPALASTPGSTPAPLPTGFAVAKLVTAPASTPVATPAQVPQHAVSLLPDGGSVTLALHPQDLGPLVVTVARHGNAVSVTITGSPAALSAISADAITDSISATGLTVSRVELAPADATARQQTAGDSRQSNQDSSQGQPQGRTRDEQYERRDTGNDTINKHDEEQE